MASAHRYNGPPEAMIRPPLSNSSRVAPWGSAYQQHHLLPLGLRRHRQISQFLEALGPRGFQLRDRKSNCLWLPAEERAALHTGAAMHRGPHPHYSDVVAARIERIRVGSQRMPAHRRDDAALRRLRRLQRALAHILSGTGPRLLHLNRRDPLRLFRDYSQLDAAIASLDWLQPVSAVWSVVSGDV